MKKYLGILATGALFLATGCSAEVGAEDDGDATTSDVSDSTGGGSDSTGGGSDSTGGGSDSTGGGSATFESILIFDKSEDPTFLNGKCGSSPGTDLDAVALYRNVADKWTLMGVGRVGSAVYDTSSASKCDNKKNVKAAAEGPVNGFVYEKNPDTGYISLNGGSIELEFGACGAGQTDVKTCDGKGAKVTIKNGDEIDIYEVDHTYKADGDGPGKGNAYDGCVCYADQYKVKVRTKMGVDAGSFYLGAADGSTTYKGTQSGDLKTSSAVQVVVP